jgi:hypothetical protein
MPLRSSVKPAATDLARDLSERIIALARLLPAALKPVFAAWLAKHSEGAVLTANKPALIIWLFGMHPEQAQAEYHLILAEIAWLELAAESIQVHTLEKEVL